jgi:hypothetical protein
MTDLCLHTGVVQVSLRAEARGIEPVGNGRDRVVLMLTDGDDGDLLRGKPKWEVPPKVFGKERDKSFVRPEGRAVDDDWLLVLPVAEYRDLPG